MAEAAANVTPEAGRMVHLRFKPLWLYVDAIREFCGFFARATFDDKKVGQRVGVIVHELVENAIRYGDDEELELRVERTPEGMAISVANTISEARAEQLQRVFEHMNSMDPAQCFLDAVRRSVSHPEGAGGLGLPRVRHEGGVELTLRRTPRRVCVTALGIR